MHKQCYSPSTHQMVRPNIPYSASPSPTQSPTRQRILRSLSPITTKTALKRRYAGSVDEVESKRSCGVGAAGVFVRNSTSPLVTDRTFPYPPTIPQQFAQPTSANVNCTPSSLSVGVRRLTNLESIMECNDSDSASDVQKDVSDVDVIDVQMNELSPQIGCSQPPIIAEPKTCDICTDDYNCASRKSSAEEEQQVQQVVECPYEPFLRSD